MTRALGFSFYPLAAAVASRTDLTPAAKLLWALVARDGEAGRAVSVRTAARELGIDSGTVGRSLRLLLRAGLLRQQGRGRLATRGQAGQAAVYVAVPPSAGVCRMHAHPECTRTQDVSAGVCKTPTPALQDVRARACGKPALPNRGDSREGEKAPPSPGAPRLHDDGHGNGQVDDEALLRIAFPGGASEKQHRALVNAAAEARRAGADEPALWLALRRATGKPWAALGRLAERLAQGPAEVPAPVKPERPEAVIDPALGVRITALAPRLAGLVFEGGDGARVEVLGPQGDEGRLGLCVRGWRGDAARGPGVRHRLGSEADFAEFPDLEAAVLAQGAVA